MTTVDFFDIEYRNSFRKLFTALMVPYKPGTFDIDEEAYRRLLRYFLQPKFVDAEGGLIVNPEAGEVFYLTFEEKRRLLEIAMEEAGGKMMIIAGACDLTTENTVKDAVAAKDLGADGVFFMPPMGSGDITRGLNLHAHPEIWTDVMDALVDASGLPLIVHPTAGSISAYGSGIPEGPALAICKRVPAIVGWKMTYSYLGWYKVAKALRTLELPVAVLAALGSVWHTALLNEHFDGSVNGSLCYAMEPMVDHVLAWRENNLDKAKTIWKSGLEEFHDYVYGDPARMHIKYKIGTWLRGLVPEPFMRPPQPRPMREEIAVMKSCIERLGLSLIHEDEINRVLNNKLVL